MTTALQAIAFKAQTHPKHRFQNLVGLLDRNLLYQSWGQLNKQAKPGIDGVTTEQYEQNLPVHIHQLAHDLKSQNYRADPIQRVFIPKANGKQRPLGLPTVKDKVAQQAVSNILQSIWEQDFLPNSYGYRPNKSAHQAVHSLATNLQFKGYGYIVEADIKGFFDNMDHDWLVRMLEQRIDDKALIRLIKQWLKARIRSPEGEYSKPESGTPQGGVISPVLANIYLHYALDLWFEKKIKPTLQGNAMLIRYADDFVIATQYRGDARRIYGTIPQRLKQFGLEVAPEKTSLQRFSRFHQGREGHFVFLGFEFYWGEDAKGKPHLKRRTARKKLKQTLKAFNVWIKLNRFKKLNELIPMVRRKLLGFQNYFGLPDNSWALNRVYYFVIRKLQYWLNRRGGRKRSYDWQAMGDVLRHFNIRSLRISKRPIVVDWY
jgi:group II intron reverse transcriptase/maturase